MQVLRELNKKIDQCLNIKNNVKLENNIENFTEIKNIPQTFDEKKHVKNEIDLLTPILNNENTDLREKIIDLDKKITNRLKNLKKIDDKPVFFQTFKLELEAITEENSFSESIIENSLNREEENNKIKNITNELFEEINNSLGQIIIKNMTIEKEANKNEKPIKRRKIGNLYVNEFNHSTSDQTKKLKEKLMQINCKLKTFKKNPLQKKELSIFFIIYFF